MSGSNSNAAASPQRSSSSTDADSKNHNPHAGGATSPRGSSSGGAVYVFNGDSSNGSELKPQASTVSNTTSSMGGEAAMTVGTTKPPLLASTSSGVTNASALDPAPSSTTDTTTTASSPNRPPPSRFPPKPQPLEGRILSASEVALASKAKSVTPARKDQLLEQARASRLEWIRQVPFPYDTQPTTTATMEQDPLAPLRETHAGRQMPQALSVLEHLYGLSSSSSTTVNPTNVLAVRQSIDALAAQVHAPNAIPTPEQARKMVLDDNNAMQQNDQDHLSLLSAYHSFVQKLSHPSAAVLVQWMRTFCRNLVQEMQQSSPKSLEQQQAAKETLVRMVQSYAASTMDAVCSHALWKDDISSSNTSNDSRMMTRRAFESFLYGHCRSVMDSVLWTDDLERREEEWKDRTHALQFVTARHLEVACLQDYDPPRVQTILQEPVQALLSLPSYHAPYEKLQRILAMYRNINAALTKTLNPDLDETNDERKRKKKLPSADDILPTIILTVLQARPDRLQYHLQLIDDFCPPEQLRGEAGYAYTNLYGAIQFLSDLNLQVSTKEEEAKDAKAPENLSISAEEFQQGLATCRAAAQERLATKQQTAADDSKDGTTSLGIVPALSVLESLSRLSTDPVITAQDVRSARAAGETINVEWALRHYKQSKPADMVWDMQEQALTEQEEAQQQQQQQQQGMDETAGSTTSAKPPESEEPDEDATELANPTSKSAAAATASRRSYTFLSRQPEDIKVTDLPLLLEEYRRMVHTTEELLAERHAKLSSEKKKQLSQDEKDLYERVKVVDPSLLEQTVRNQTSNNTVATDDAARTRSTADSNTKS